MMDNPYLSSQAGAITNRVTQNLTQSILPQIGSAAGAVGGYGGSRQGVAEGLAIGQTNQNLGDSLANLYGTNYQQDQQNALQSRAINNSYNLGLGGLGLQNQNQNFNFYTQQRGLDQSGAQLGANLYGSGNAGYLGQATGITGIGNTQQQAPWNATNNAGNVFSQFSGLGGGSVQSQSGSALGGAVGAGLAGAQIGNNLGFGSRYGFAPVNNSQNNNGYGGYGNTQYGDGYGPQ